MSYRIHSVAGVLEFLRRMHPAHGIALLSLCLAVGCSDVASTGSASQPTAEARNSALPPPIQTGPAIEQAPASDPPVVPAAELAPAAEQPAAPEAVDSSGPAQPRKIIGKTTQDVRDAEKEEAKGAKRVKPRITGQDPISVSGSAYAAIVGRIEQLQIEDALNKFKALNDRYPKDFAEFKREIINGYRIRLPQLPFYQEYGYDARNHKLVILEYPDKKAQLPGGGN